MPCADYLTIYGEVLKVGLLEVLLDNLLQRRLDSRRFLSDRRIIVPS